MTRFAYALVFLFATTASAAEVTVKKGVAYVDGEAIFEWGKCRSNTGGVCLVTSSKTGAPLFTMRLADDHSGSSWFEYTLNFVDIDRDAQIPVGIKYAGDIAAKMVAMKVFDEAGNIDLVALRKFVRAYDVTPKHRVELTVE